jgi:hypothetical protein
MVSELPPAAKGDTMRTGLCGQSCALAAPAPAATTAPSIAAVRPRLHIPRRSFERADIAGLAVAFFRSSFIHGGFSASMLLFQGAIRMESRRIPGAYERYEQNNMNNKPLSNN